MPVYQPDVWYLYGYDCEQINCSLQQFTENHFRNFKILQRNQNVCTYRHARYLVCCKNIIIYIYEINGKD